MARRSVAFGLAALPILVSVSACYPYDRSGDYYAGPVDPAGFPAAYKGAGFSQAVQFGTFSPVGAFVDGNRTGYYSFPVPASVADPLALKDGAKVRPLAYVFDPKDAEPFPDTPTCVSPKSYVYDPQRDFVRYDEQGSILTALPTATVNVNTGVVATSYIPVYAEVKVQAHGMPCQTPKSHEDLVIRQDVTFPDPLIPAPVGAPPPARATGTRDGRFLAWAVIDPAATVLFPDGSTDYKGDGPQKFGWFNHYLLAYIDGGYIPSQEGMRTNPDMTTRTITEAIPQLLYVPNKVFDKAKKAVVAGALGNGHDVLEHARGEVNYSPICHVRTFTPTDPMALPTSANEIETMMLDPETTPKFVYCLQVTP